MPISIWGCSIQSKFGFFRFFFGGGRGLCKNRALKETEVHRGMKLQKAEASCSLMIKHQILRVPSIAAFLIVVL